MTVMGCALQECAKANGSMSECRGLGTDMCEREPAQESDCERVCAGEDT